MCAQCQNCSPSATGSVLSVTSLLSNLGKKLLTHNETSEWGSGGSCSESSDALPHAPGVGAVEILYTAVTFKKCWGLQNFFQQLVF